MHYNEKENMNVHVGDGHLVIVKKRLDLDHVENPFYDENDPNSPKFVVAEDVDIYPPGTWSRWSERFVNDE